MNQQATPQEVLKQYWGYDAFRPLQEEIIQSVLDGKDTLALLPTGGGKSLCYQVPALCQEGITIVISPLIALMKDQVYHLKEKGIAAEAIYSGMHFKDIDRILDNCVYGGVKLLYLSPERLGTELAIERIKKMKVNLLAVDEAHCISQWGYDFRPSYLQIAEIREWLPDTPVLAVTATATSTVVVDIQEQLEFKKENVLQKSFKRDNLAYVVLEEENKLEKLLEIFQKIKGTGVVYVRSRRKTKEIAYFLQRKGIGAIEYHAGLEMDTRNKRQQDWLSGKTRIMVATNAFGMGIDKSNVRAVVHLDLPDSLEAYFQEAGRGGRDGLKAYAVLLYQPVDKENLLRNFSHSFPEMSELRRTYQALGSYFQLAVGGGLGNAYDFDLVAFSKTYQMEPLRVFSCLKVLEKEEWIVLTDAVFIPSQLRVLVNKEELYAYQISHKQYDLVLKTILRTYQGAFQSFVKIREQQIAQFLKVPISDLIRAFEKLSADGIINYKPKKDKPQLIFVKERVDGINLSIDQKRYQTLKSRQEERIHKAIAYAEQDLCRQQQLLHYFGEMDAEECGTCDVCLGRNKEDLSDQEFQAYKDKIMEYLQGSALPLKELIDSFSPKHRERAIRVLQYLLDEQVLEQKANKIEIVSKG